MTAPTRISAADFLARIKAKPRKREGRVKGAQKVTLGALKFDSKWERDRYLILAERQKRGLIANLAMQVRIPLKGANGLPILGENGRPRVYVADFVYDDAETGRQVIEDAKGFRTEVFTLKKAILRAQGITISEVRRDGK